MTSLQQAAIGTAVGTAEVRAEVATGVATGLAGATVSPDAVTAAPGSPPARPRKRLATLDLMRGYYVGVLAAIHLDYVPSLLGLVDGRGALLTSEADSALVLGALSLLGLGILLAITALQP